MEVGLQIPWAEPVLDEQEIAEVVDTLRSGWVGMGPRVKRFEASMAEYVGVPHAIAACNGTAALDMCLKALDAHGIKLGTLLHNPRLPRGVSQRPKKPRRV